MHKIQFFTMASSIIGFCLLALMISCTDSKKDRLLGGLEEARPADAAIFAVAESVQPAIMGRLQQQNIQSTMFKPVSYRSQVVAGVNFFIKIQIDDNQDTGFVHARVFQSLQGSNQLVGLETDHSAMDPLTSVPTFL